jgi:UDP-3-O-[3-hydroxymyristoyl] N-acetylglucosamine deacetylase
VRQHTLAEKVSCTGIGSHTGAPVQMTLHPAAPDSGIVFVRTDGARPVEVPARPASIVSSRPDTCLGRGETTIGTVEHLLSALYALGVDNARIGIDGPELPVMDGSAASYVYLIRSAGLFPQRAPRCVLRMRRRVEVREGDRSISIAPGRSFRVTYAVEYDHPAIGRQQFRVRSLGADWFERELAAARTFGFLDEMDRLRCPSSLDNAVVLDDSGVVNGEGLRWPDEFVRHKVVDLLGDLALLGMPLQGHVRVERGGHGLHHRLLAALLDDPDAWYVHDPDPTHRAALHLIPVPRSA